MLLRQTALLYSVVILLVAPAGATTWVVDPGGLEDFTSVAAAVDSASAADTILVRPGNYQGTVRITPEKSGLLLKGDGPVENIVLSADTLVVGIWSTDPAARLEGLTISGSNIYGALWIQGAKAEIVGCVVRDNTGPGGCQGVGGGGKAIFFSDILIEDCVFENNTSWEAPGGFIVWNSRADIRNNIFRNNRSCYGGGLEIYHCQDNGPSIIEGNLFLNNEAITWGGGIFNVDSSPVIRNNTFSGNGGSGRAAIWVLGGSPDIHHNIIYDSYQAVRCQAEPGYPASTPIIGDNICWQIGVSPITNCPSTGGLTVEDPLFCDAANGDYHLCANSPGVVGGVATYGAFDVGCGDCGPSPVKKMTWGAMRQLLQDGAPPQNGSSDGD
jgi:hypothetical protein